MKRSTIALGCMFLLLIGTTAGARAQLPSTNVDTYHGTTVNPACTIDASLVGAHTSLLKGTLTSSVSVSCNFVSQLMGGSIVGADGSTQLVPISCAPGGCEFTSSCQHDPENTSFFSLSCRRASSITVGGSYSVEINLSVDGREPSGKIHYWQGPFPAGCYAALTYVLGCTITLGILFL